MTDILGLRYPKHDLNISECLYFYMHVCNKFHLSIKTQERLYLLIYRDFLEHVRSE